MLVSQTEKPPLSVRTSCLRIKGKFLDDLRDNAFNGTNKEDMVEHIKYFLKIVDPINLPNVHYERLRIAIFPISLVGNASKWFDEFKGSMTTWVDLTKKNWKNYPPSRTCNIVGTGAKRDPTNTMFEEWLASKFANHMMMDPFTKKVLWDFWKKSDNQEGVIDEGFSNLEKANNDDEHKIVDTELFTRDIKRTKTYEDYKNKWNNEVDEPWSDNGAPYEIYHEWYDDLLDVSLKEEALKQKAIYEKSWGDASQTQEPPVCKIRRFEIIKYSFGHKEEYVAIKEYEYDDLVRTNKDTCHAYQEIFRNMDEEWLVTRAE
ncbi:hypothetical protein Tco_0644535 [Tanacetum coccineum]